MAKAGAPVSVRTLVIATFMSGLVASGCGIPDAEIEANVITATEPYGPENVSTCSDEAASVAWINEGSRGRHYVVEVHCGRVGYSFRLPADQFEEETPGVDERGSVGLRLIHAGPFESSRCEEYNEPVLDRIIDARLILWEKGRSGFGGRHRTYIGEIIFSDPHDCFTGQIDFEIRAIG
jgi:hypothetical protein